MVRLCAVVLTGRASTAILDATAPPHSAAAACHRLPSWSGLGRFSVSAAGVGGRGMRERAGECALKENM